MRLHRDSSHSPRMAYQIKDVADLTGIPRNTLIAWERRYDVVKPVRAENGYRYYSDEDLKTLLRVKRRH